MAKYKALKTFYYKSIRVEKDHVINLPEKVAQHFLYINLVVLDALENQAKATKSANSQTNQVVIKKQKAVLNKEKIEV